MVLEEILKEKKNVYHLNGAEDNVISDAEDRLGLEFAPEYKDYLKTYGLLSVGAHELTGICPSKRLNVVDSTLREKEDNAAIPNDMYLVEYIGVENLTIWQNTKGEVFEVPYKGSPLKIYDSLADYIKSM